MLYICLFVFQDIRGDCLDQLDIYGFDVVETPITDGDFKVCKALFEAQGSCVDLSTIESFFEENKKTKTKSLLDMLAEINNNLDYYETMVKELLQKLLGLSEKQNEARTQKEDFLFQLNDVRSQIMDRELPLLERLLLSPSAVARELDESLNGQIEMEEVDKVDKNLDLELKTGEDFLEQFKEFEVDNAEQLDAVLEKIDLERERLDLELDFYFEKEVALMKMMREAKELLEENGVLDLGSVVKDTSKIPEEGMDEIFGQLDEVKMSDFRESEAGKEMEEKIIRKGLEEITDEDRKKEMINDIRNDKKPVLTDEEIKEGFEEKLLAGIKGQEEEEEDDEGITFSVNEDEKMLNEFKRPPKNESDNEEKNGEEKDVSSGTQLPKSPEVPSDETPKTPEDPSNENTEVPSNETPKTPVSNQPGTDETSVPQIPEISGSGNNETNVPTNHLTNESGNTQTNESQTGEPSKTNEPGNTQTNESQTPEPRKTNESGNTQTNESQTPEGSIINVSDNSGSESNENINPGIFIPNNSESESNENTNTPNISPDSRFLEESKYDQAKNALRDISQKIKKSKENYKKLEKLEDELIHKFDENKNSEIEKKLEEKIKQSGPLDILAIFRSDVMNLFTEEIKDDMGNLKKEILDLYKEINGFRKNVKQLEMLFEKLEIADKMSDYIAFGDGDKFSDEEVEQHLEQVKSMVLDDHFKEDESVQVAVRMLLEINLGNTNINDFVKDVNTNVGDLVKDVISETGIDELKDKANIKDIIKNSLLGELKGLPQEMKDLATADFESMTNEEMMKEKKVLPIRLMKSKIEALYQENVSKMEDYDKKMKEKLDKIEDMISKLLEKVEGLLKNNKPKRTELYTNAKTTLTQAKEKLETRLKELIGKLDLAEDPDLVEALNYKIYMLKVLLDMAAEGLKKIEALFAAVETDGDLTEIFTILKREARQIVYQLNIDYEDSVWIFEEMRIAFDSDEVEDNAEVEENIIKLQTVLEMLKLKDMLKVKYRDKEFRHQILQPLIKMAAGTVCAMAAGNASEFFTKNSEGVLMVPIDSAALDFISMNTLPLVNIICVALSPMRMIFELLGTVPPASMTGYLTMCENVDDLTLCESDFSLCPQYIKEAIVSFLDSPVGESKMENIKLTDLKENSEKAALKIEENSRKMEFKDEGKKRIQIMSNEVKVDLLMNQGNINIKDGKVEISQNMNPEVARDQKTKEEFMQQSIDELKTELKIEAPAPAPAQVARVLETSASTSTSSNESQYVYTTGESVNLVGISEETGLNYDSVEDSLTNIPTLSQAEAESFLSVNHGKDEEEKPNSDRRIVATIMSFLVLLLLR